MRTYLCGVFVSLTLLFTLPAFAQTGDDSETGIPSEHDRIYYLQHRLLPKWTHQSDGAFYGDLRAEYYTNLLSAGSVVMGEEWSGETRVLQTDEIRDALRTDLCQELLSSPKFSGIP